MTSLYKFRDRSLTFYNLVYKVNDSTTKVVLSTAQVCCVNFTGLTKQKDATSHSTKNLLPNNNKIKKGTSYLSGSSAPSIMAKTFSIVAIVSFPCKIQNNSVKPQGNEPKRRRCLESNCTYKIR